MTRKDVTMTVLSLLPLLGGAPALAAKADLPKPVAEMECLVGRWTGQGTMKLGADTANVTLTWDCRRVSGNFGVQCVATIKGIPGMAAYQETDLFGYDAGSNTWHWYAVTSGGETHDHKAPAMPGKTIQFVYEGMTEGKPMKEVVALSFGDDEKSLELSSETFVAGQSAALLKGKATKR